MARPIGRVGKAVRWIQRRPAVASLAALTLLVTTVAAVLLFTGYLNEARLREHADSARVEAEDARTVAEKSRRQAETSAKQNRAQWYATAMSLAAQTWEEGNIKRLTEILAAQVPKNGEADLRGFEWFYWWQKCKPYFNSTILQDETLVQCAQYSPDGRWLVTGVANGTIRFFDRKRMEFTAAQKVCKKRFGFEFFPDGSKLFTISDGQVIVWRIDENQKLSRITQIAENDGPIDIATVAPDAATISTANIKGKIAIWNAATGEHQRTLNEEEGKIVSLAYAPKGNLIAAGDADSDIVAIWEVNTGRELARFSSAPDHTGGMAFDPTGRYLATSAYQRIHLFDTTSRVVIENYRSHPNHLVSGIAWSPVGGIIATSGDDDVLELIDPATGDKTNKLVGFQGLTSITFSPDGKHIAAVGSDTFAVEWLIPNRRAREQVTTHSDIVTVAKIAPNSSQVASASKDGKVVIWDATTLEFISRFDTNIFPDLAFFPDQTLLLARGYLSVKLWDLETKSERREFETTANVPSIAVSADGTIFAYQPTLDSIAIVDSKSLQEVRTIRGHLGNINGIWFSPDNKVLLSAANDKTGSGEVVFTDLATGVSLGSYNIPDKSVNCASFSPDGSLCALGLSEGMIVLLNSKSAQFVRRLQGSDVSKITSVAFAIDGRTLAATGSDIRFWDVNTGTEKGHVTAAYPNNIVFNHTGTFAVVAASDGAYLLNAEAIADRNQLAGPAFSVPTPVVRYPPEVLYPKILDTEKKLAAVYGEAGHTDEAVQLYENLADTYRRAGRLDEETQVYETAEQLIKQVLEQGHFWRGAILAARLGPEMVDELMQFVATHQDDPIPDAFELALPLGELRIIVGDPIGGEVAIRAAMQQDQIPAFVYKSLGWSLLAQAKNDEAKQAFEMVLSRHRRDDGEYHLNNLTADEMTAAYFLDLISKRHYSESFVDADYLPWFYIGQRHEIEGDIPEAIEAYQQAVKMGVEKTRWRAFAEWRLSKLQVSAKTE